MYALPPSPFFYLDAVPEDACRPLWVLPDDVVVDLVEQRDHGVDGERLLDRVRVQLVQAELAVPGEEKREKCGSWSPSLSLYLEIFFKKNNNSIYNFKRG